MVMVLKWPLTLEGRGDMGSDMDGELFGNNFCWDIFYWDLEPSLVVLRYALWMHFPFLSFHFGFLALQRVPCSLITILLMEHGGISWSHQFAKKDGSIELFISLVFSYLRKVMLFPQVFPLHKIVYASWKNRHSH